MTAPASACPYRSNCFNGNKFSPKVAVTTTVSIVNIVTLPKITATSITAEKSCLAAGYIKIGINGSHGPRIKIINNAQGTGFAKA